MRLRHRRRQEDPPPGRPAPPAPARPSAPPPARPGPDPADDPALADERRLREAGGPDDRSLYRCGCGYIFEAAVTTDVACPHCGATQAW